MPYLGPKSFKTAPLTSQNLAFLNNTESRNQNNVRVEASGQPIFFAEPEETCPEVCGNSQMCTVLPESDTDSTKSRAGSSLQHSTLKETTPNQSPELNKIVGSSTNDQSSRTDSLCASSLNCSKNSESSDTSINTETELIDDDTKTLILSQSPTLTYNNQFVTPASINSNQNDLRLIRTHSGSVSGESIDSNPRNELIESLFSATNTPKLLRKKSGELVKSSLKLHHLTRSNSMPNTKTVRFASRLENIKFFKKSEKPNAVSYQKSKLARTHWDFDSPNSSSVSSSDEETNRAEISSGTLNMNENSLPALTDDYDNLLNIEDTTKWKILSNDCPYNPSVLNFAKLASNNNVILESVKLNSAGSSLIGFIYAKNIAFEKKLIVKLTLNNWKSFVEIDNSNYISSNHIFKYYDSDSMSYDKFSFIIKLDDLLLQDDKNGIDDFDSLKLEFCVHYIVNNESYWDNNNNENYKIVLNKNKSSKYAQLNKANNTSHLVASSSYDLEDASIKLKDNNNFKDLLVKPEQVSHNFNNLRTSNFFGLKKIRSESSLPSISSTVPSECNNKSTSSLSTSKFSNMQNATGSAFSVNYSTFSSKSLSGSPSLSNSQQFSPKTNKSDDYEQIIKNFCFFGKKSEATIPSNDSALFPASTLPSAHSYHSFHEHHLNQNQNFAPNGYDSSVYKLIDS